MTDLYVASCHCCTAVTYGYSNTEDTCLCQDSLHWKIMRENMRANTKVLSTSKNRQQNTHHCLYHYQITLRKHIIKQRGCRSNAETSHIKYWKWLFAVMESWTKAAAVYRNKTILWLLGWRAPYLEQHTWQVHREGCESVNNMST